MNRTHVIFSLALTLSTGAALADNTTVATMQRAPVASASSAIESMLHPGAGRVAFMIRTTQPRRVLMHDQYVCTTPCRLYVAPGPLQVTLQGWGSTTYNWEIPSNGGSVSLLSRSASGQLDPIPSDAQTFAHSTLRASN